MTYIEDLILTLINTSINFERQNTTVKKGSCDQFTVHFYDVFVVIWHD